MNINNINDIKSKFASYDEQLAELQKAQGPQTTTTASGGIIVDFDDDLERLVYQTAPTYEYLKQKGVEKASKSYKVGYRKKNRATTASFISETANLPLPEESSINDVSTTMRSIVYPIEVSDMAQKGTEAVDLLADEIQDGLLDISATKNQAILQGNSSSNANSFDGLTKICSTHKTTLNDSISLEDVDALCQEIIDDGGHPTAIITTAAIARRLKDLIYDKVRFVETVEATLGFNVTAYVTPEGSRIPIIVDQNINVTDGNGHKLFVVDEQSLRIRELMAPAVIELAKTKLSTSKVIANFMTFYCRAEYKNGFLQKITPTVE